VFLCFCGKLPAEGSENHFIVANKENNHYFSFYSFNKKTIMENFDELNWPAIAVAALAYFALGSLWYSKILFAKRWIADSKIDINDPNAKKGMGLMFGGSLVLMFVQCLAIAILAERIGISGNGWMSGIKLGVVTGGCFAATAVGVNYLYEKKPLSLFLINGGYAIVGNIIAAIIICCWA
jgi:hypothetical protein